MQAAPGQFALDLALDAGGGAALFTQIAVELGRRLAEIGRHALIALLYFGRIDLDVVGGGFLDLERFVDQVAQNLDAQPLLFRFLHLAAIGGDDERQALVDVRPGDDPAVDDRRRLADIGVALAKDGDVLWQVELLRRDIAAVIDRLGEKRLDADTDQRRRQEQGAKARADAMKQAGGRGSDRQHRRQKSPIRTGA